MVEKGSYDSDQDEEAAYVAPPLEESDQDSDDEILIISKGKGKRLEESSEEEIDSDDPDGEPLKKKRKIIKKPVVKKVVKKAVAKKEEGGEEKKVKKPKAANKDVDGKNTRVVKVNSTVYPAPETDRQSFIPASPSLLTPRNTADTSILLPTTMSFLKDLTQPENNDRDWFKARDPIYRHAEQNWRSFIKALIPVASRADWSLPVDLPVKDLVGRIYRDVRFSKDKRPSVLPPIVLDKMLTSCVDRYKTHLTVSMTRTGRKGPFAGYYLHMGHDQSFFAAGAYEIAPSELSTIRHSIITDSTPFRNIIAAKKFTKVFGKAVVGKKGSIYGRADELKTKPKITGVGKDHKDIDLLKLKSFAVSHRLSNEVNSLLFSLSLLSTTDARLMIGSPLGKLSRNPLRFLRGSSSFCTVHQRDDPTDSSRRFGRRWTYSSERRRRGSRFWRRSSGREQ